MQEEDFFERPRMKSVSLLLAFLFSCIFISYRICVGSIFVHLWSPSPFHRSEKSLLSLHDYFLMLTALVQAQQVEVLLEARCPCWPPVGIRIAPASQEMDGLGWEGGLGFETGGKREEGSTCGRGWLRKNREPLRIRVPSAPGYPPAPVGAATNFTVGSICFLDEHKTGLPRQPCSRSSLFKFFGFLEKQEMIWPWQSLPFYLNSWTVRPVLRANVKSEERSTLQV